jgi:hypothetical protein
MTTRISTRLARQSDLSDPMLLLGRSITPSEPPAQRGLNFNALMSTVTDPSLSAA